MTTRKKALAVLLAALQVAWSFSWGAYEALAQVVNSASAQVHTGAVPVIPASAVGAFSPVGQVQALPQASLTASFVPGLSPVPALTPSAVMAPAALTPSAMTAAPALRAARSAPSRAAVSALARPVSAAPALQAAALSAASKDAVLATVRRDAPVEDSSRAGAESFAALYPEALIEGSKGALADPVRAPAASSRRSVFRFAPVAAAKNDAPLPVETPAAKTPAPVPAKPFWHRPLVRVAAFAGVAAVAALGPLLAANVGVVAAAGSVALSVIGIPQIWKNFKGGKDGVKDLAIASPLIWFAAATLLSVVSIGSGASLWWNLANVAGVVESGAVVGQINWHKRDRKELKATALTALAVLAPLPLIATATFMPLSAWLTASFTAAMGLLWVLNWPQIRRNVKIFQAEGRAPQGIAPLYPALVVAGSLLHLYAALMGGDVRWAVNAAIGILTAAIVLAQIYAPKSANALIGPVVRLIDRLIPGKAAPAAAPADAALKAKAKALVAPLLPARLSRHAATDGGKAMAKALEAARALPGRSVVFLEAPTAAGKSTLAEGLKTTLGERVKVFPVDRYFKPRAEVPVGPDGQPDFDRPESLYLDRVASDIRTLLAGGKVELPLNDMATQTTRFDSGEYLTLGADEVLIVDSIYASHDKLIEAAEGVATLNVYLDAPAVIRLARRLRRDRLERGIPAETNLKRWPVILQDEKEFILPLKRRADFVVNLIGAEEIGKLADTYGDVLAAEWAAKGEDPALTARFLEGIRSSLLADQNSRPMRILITGPPGSGKTTFGKRMARDYGMIHISVGELLRTKAAADPALAAEMSKGELVDSALVRGVVLERLSRPDVQAAGFILDGFPRRPEEIGVIESWLKEGNTIDALVNLKTPEAELQRRITARGRADDSPEVFKRRMEIYREETAPVLEHFRKTVRVLETDAAGPDAETNYAAVRELVDRVRAEP